MILDVGEDKDSASAVHAKWDKLKAAYVRSRKRVPSGNLKEYKYAAALSFLDNRQSTDPGETYDRDSSVSPVNPVKSNILSIAFAGYLLIVLLFLEKCAQEKINIQTQHVERIDDSQRANSSSKPTSTKSPHPNDEELNGFCSFMKSHLKKLPIKLRIQAQKDIFEVVANAIQNHTAI